MADARALSCEKAELPEDEMEILIKTSELFDPGIIGIDAMETDEGLVVQRCPV